MNYRKDIAMNEKLQEKAKELAMRPYFIKVTRDETTDNQPIFLAHVLELDGCFGQGDTPEDAVTDLKAAMIDFIASLLEDKLSVPEPAEIVVTTSSTTSKTFTISNHDQDRNIDIANPHRNLYVPVG